MQNITIEPLQENELSILQTISITTFKAAFEQYNTAANMQHYIANNISISNLKAEFEDKSNQFYFAKIENVIVGYLKLIHHIKQEADTESFEIERIYVLSNYQNLKIGAKLLQFSIAIAQQFNVSKIWLGVWEKNVDAIRFYVKNGFQQFDQHIFMLGNDAQTDILMQLKLNN